MADGFIYFFIYSGPLFALTLVAGILFTIQTVFIFLLWRKGEKAYFLKMISYAITSVGLIISSVIAFILISGGSHNALMTFGLIFFTIFAPVAAVISILDYIWQKWLKKEGKA